jgi:hypothetical protein
MRIENLRSMVQARSARPAAPPPRKPEPDVAQLSPSTKVNARSTFEKTEPATLAGLLALQEDSPGAGSKSGNKSPAQQVRMMQPDLAGRAFGAAVSALASGRASVPPPAEEVSEPVEEVVPPVTESSSPIDVEPEVSLVEELTATIEELQDETSL